MPDPKQELTAAIENISGDIPKPRENLSEAEKIELVKKIGPRTARSILSMRGKTAAARIPFLFSSVDTQAVVDLLANDCDQVIAVILKK